MRLDEKTARRIARGRFASQTDEFHAGMARFRIALESLPSKRSARLRRMADAIHAAFGRLLFSVTVQKRCVDVVVLMCEPDNSAALTLLHFYPDGEPDGFVLANITSHTVARLIERKLDIDPINAIRDELDDGAFGQIIDYILGTSETGMCVDYGTEVKTRSGKFRVKTEINDGGRTELTLMTWIANKGAGSRVRIECDQK